MNRIVSNFRRTCIAVLAMAACMAMPIASHALVPQDDAAQLIPVSAPASYLGVNIRDLDDHSARMLGLKSRQGVEVTAVDHDAPAGKAGMHLRDVILTVDGKAVTSAQQFRETMRGFPPGKSVTLGVIREAKPMKFTIQLADRVRLQQQAIQRLFSAPMPELGNSFSNAVALQQQLANEDAAGDSDQQTVLTRPYRIGAELDAIGPQLSTFFGVKDGTGMLVSNVEPDSPAAAAGLQAGDVILKLNDEAVASPFDWMRAMQNIDNKPIRLTIVRSKKVEVIMVNPPKTQAEVEWPQVFNQNSSFPELKLDEGNLKSELDAMQRKLKDNPALTEEALRQALDHAHTTAAPMPDEATMQWQINDGLKRGGFTEGGQLTPEIQGKIDEAMQQMQQRIDQLPGKLGLLQPY